MTTATEHSQRIRSNWELLGVATATENSELTIAAEQSTLASCVVSIGSVMIRRIATTDSAIRVMQCLRQEIEYWLSPPISKEEVKDLFGDCENYSQSPNHSRRSWSGILEAISRCVAAYTRATENTDNIACEDIVKKLKAHIHVLVHKCAPQAYPREHAIDIITEYMWNRTCNVAFHRVLDDIITNQASFRGELSQQDIGDALVLMEVCMCSLKDASNKMVADLSVCRSAKERTNT